MGVATFARIRPDRAWGISVIGDIATAMAEGIVKQLLPLIGDDGGTL
jgi:hypothetical protein